MDVMKLLDIAARSVAPELLAEGVAYIAKVRAAAVRAGQVVDDATYAEIDAIYNQALASTDRLDAKLAHAEKN